MSPDVRRADSVDRKPGRATGISTAKSRAHRVGRRQIRSRAPPMRRAPFQGDFDASEIISTAESRWCRWSSVRSASLARTPGQHRCSPVNKVVRIADRRVSLRSTAETGIRSRCSASGSTTSPSVGLSA